MWARNFEVALGLWLMMSPFVLSHPEGDTWLWIHDLLLSVVIVTISVLCYVRSLRRLHLAQLAVASWLMGYGWVMARAAAEAPPSSQNHIMLGLLLAMFAIVPSESSRPPDGWREFEVQRARRG